MAHGEPAKEVPLQQHGTDEGNALRAAVLGANDGLVSNLSLVMGVAGATGQDNTILIAGLAGLVAGACSMAMGEWLSVTNSREFYRSQIAAKARQLKAAPRREREEIAEIYEGKGLTDREAHRLADRLMANRRTALDTLAREELGVDPKDLGGSAWTAALWSFFLFSVGAAFPVSPYLFLKGDTAVAVSLAASGAALAAIGAITSRFTGRSFGFAAVRQIIIGFLAAGITYGIGRLLGVTTAG